MNGDKMYGQRPTENGERSLHTGIQIWRSASEALRWCTVFGLALLLGCTAKPTGGPDAGSEPPTMTAAANQAVRAGNYDEAIALYHRHLAENPTDAQTEYYLGYAYGQIGDHEREIFYYEAALDHGLQTEPLLTNLGMAYLEVDRVADALQIFKQVLAQNPANADAHYGSGMAYHRAGETAAARRALRQAVALEPDFVYFREELARLYEEAGQWVEAAEQYERILAIEPEHPDTAHKLEEARRRLREAGD